MNNAPNTGVSLQKQPSLGNSIAISNVQPQMVCFRCHDHPNEEVKGFCKDCSSGICFRCAIGKHRNHNIVNIDELDKSDLENQIGVFDNKIEMLKEKAKALLDRAKNSETHIEQLPDITMRFGEIQDRFRRGVYQELIVGELERNYIQIKDMYNKLQREEKEDQNLAEKLAQLDMCTDCTVFDYIRNVIDERNALIDQYERNLKNQKTMIAEFNHFDIKERIIDFF